MTAVIRRLAPGEELAAAEIDVAFQSSRFDAQRAARFLANPANYLLIAEREGELAGYLIAYRLDRLDRDATQLFIYEVGVAPRHRRRGIGATLMTGARQIVADESMMEAFVLADRDNEAAVRLYRSVGGIAEGPGSLLFVFPGV